MKKILTFILMLLSLSAIAQYDSIKISTPGSGLGDNLRTAGGKINDLITDMNTIQIYNISQAEMAILNGALVSTTELNRLVGVTSAVQTQLNAKAPIASPAFTGTPTVATTINPDANDGATLGVLGTAWSDLFLADDGVINWGSSNATLSANGTKITVGEGVNFDFGAGDLIINGSFLLTSPDVDISQTELSYIDGAASNIQTQLYDTTEFVTEDVNDIAYTPQSTGEVVDATGITSAMLSRVMYYSEAAATDITADPQIANGTTGQIITIVGSSDTNTLTLDDSAGLRLSAQIVLGIGDTITLLYEGNIGDWIELSRSNN